LHLLVWTEVNLNGSMDNAEMIIESLGLVARRENRRELQTALSYLLGPTRVEAGCISCQLYQDVLDPNILHFQCVWSTEDDLLRHLRSEIYKQLLILLELSAKPPLVQFHTVSQTHGMEFVHTTRQQVG
jgi:quinol monooxygenase YgiN